MNYHLISLGCPKNTADSEKLVAQLAHHGFQLVAKDQKADMTILNTCAFIQDAVDETQSKIGELIHQKRQKKLQFLIVMGCFINRFSAETLKADYPEVDLWISIRDEERLGALLTPIFHLNALSQRPLSYTKLSPSHYAYLKISEGCNHHCSYCTIPLIRGSYNSRPMDDILQQAQKYADIGVKELILVAEDTTIWGNDFYNRPALALLLRELCTIKGIEWIRIMYAYPSLITSELIQVMKENAQICAYLDMPIQHTNTAILKRMNRHYTSTDITRLVHQLRSEIPHIALRTTLILGFPGETSDMINEMADMLEELAFEQLGCFAYSPEPDTRASQLDGAVDPQETQQRIDYIMEQQLDIIHQKQDALLGKIIPVICESPGIARPYFSAPEIDTVMNITANFTPSVGKIYHAMVTGSSGYDLVGTLS